MKRKQFFCNEERNKKADIFFAVAERALLVWKSTNKNTVLYNIKKQWWVYLMWLNMGLKMKHRGENLLTFLIS
jgi:hypothetical protein